MLAELATEKVCDGARLWALSSQLLPGGEATYNNHRDKGTNVAHVEDSFVTTPIYSKDSLKYAKWITANCELKSGLSFSTFLPWILLIS